MDATTVAVDLAKTVFELALANAQWRVVSRQRLNRAQFARYLTQTSPTHLVMEACSMAHYWGRLAQQHGHRVTLVPPAYVRPYVRRSKTRTPSERNAAWMSARFSYRTRQTAKLIQPGKCALHDPPPPAHSHARCDAWQPRARCDESEDRA